MQFRAKRTNLHEKYDYPNLVSLGVGVQVMNALLLPVVLGFLFLLAIRLPEPYRLKGAYSWLVGIVISGTVLLGVYAGVAGLFAD